MAVGAKAQQRPKTPSSEAFSACREQEKIGDARACWTLWLRKFRATGSEAEVAFAEEHAKGLQPPTPSNTSTPSAPAVGGPSSLPSPSATVARASPDGQASAFVSLNSVPPSTVEIDGNRIGVTPIVGFATQPGRHTAVFRVSVGSSGTTRATRTFSVERGETTMVTVTSEDFKETAEADTSAPESTEPTPDAVPVAPEPPNKAMGYATGDVLDLCALEPKKHSTKFQKQRVVLFAPADAQQVNDDPKIRQAEGGRLVRDIFTARFPLQRFNNVVTELPGKKGWAGSESLSMSELEAFVKKPNDEGDEERNARLERERQFVAYSLACADYVAAPVITSHEAKWEDAKVKTKQGETTVKMLSLKLGGTLAIFKRDGEGFRRIAAIEVSVPSLADTLSDTAAASVPNVNIGGVDLLSAAMKVPSLPSYISAVPDPECLAGKGGREGLGALISCAKGQGTAEQVLGSIDERLGPVCRKSRSASGTERDSLSVQCEVRARAFQLARAFQKEARSVDGWKLFGVLANAETAPSFALGKEEGVNVGYAFQVVDGDGERVAFFKVTDVGAGGENGEQEPSMLSLRSGEAPEGARLDEWPQVGLVFTPHGSVGLLALNGAPTRLTDGTNTAQFIMPSVVFGGGATFGYDLSSLLGWTETYGRIGGGIFSGVGAGIGTILIPIDLWFEKGFYLGRIITLVTALGPTMQITNLSLPTPKPGWPVMPKDLHLSTTQYGAAARFGLDFYLGPDWSLRTEGVARVPLNASSYSESDNKPIPAALAQRSDYFATIGLNLGITKVF